MNPRLQQDGPIRTMQLLPPAANRCQVCAAAHEPEEPHNPESVYWATARHMAGLPAPTWDLALEHVAEPLRAKWVDGLAAHGITVSERTGS